MYDEEGFRIDPIEVDPKYKEIFSKIDDEIAEDLKNHPQKDSLGFCHIYWDRKQEILKDKYHIRWKTPTEMNPEVLFD